MKKVILGVMIVIAGLCAFLYGKELAEEDKRKEEEERERQRTSMLHRKYSKLYTMPFSDNI